jgi:penicillin-binding protein 1A
LVSAYTTFANNGVYIEPMSILRIEDRDGNVLYEHPTQLQQEVISPETAYVLVDMMRGVIRGGDWGFGTGVRMRNMGIRQDVAGKTGTSQNSADNWFVAMFPHVVAGAWVGGEDRRIRFPQNTVIGQGARTALPIVADWALSCINDSDLNWSYEGFVQPAGFIPDPPQDEIDRLEREADRDDTRGRIEW